MMITGLLVFSLVILMPVLSDQLSWRMDAAGTYLRGVLRPVQAVPTPHPKSAGTGSGQVASEIQPTAVVTNLPPNSTDEAADEIPASAPSPTAGPGAVSLSPPAWERQDWNNCGPATLAQYLRFYGWEGDQFDISETMKPERADRNVNIEELVHYVRNQAGWLQAQYRVGGDLATLKRFLAAGIPVMIEAGYYFEGEYWPNDDRWAGHYLLLTGYNDEMEIFTAQDSFVGPDQQITYQELDGHWKAFNRIIVLIYPPEQEALVKNLLGPDWDPEQNRQRALQQSQRDVDDNPDDAFAWFNLGTNLVSLERYQEAARAYDRAREIGFPQRMLRYQFGPFLAYFHANRLEDLQVLTDYALQRTPNAEEALLWKGWSQYRSGDTAGALSSFRKALEHNPTYQDAQYALDFMGAAP